MSSIMIPTHYYQHFDADFSLDVPGEGYGGWKKANLPISVDHTAVVVLHAWDAGTREKYRGWHRAVEFFPRADRILKTVFPDLLKTIRGSGLKLFHVASDKSYCSHYPGYLHAAAIAEPEPARPELAAADPVLEELKEYRRCHVFVGEHNEADVERGFRNMKFPREAEPHGDEGIAVTANQLFALCRESGVNHIVYMGFAVNWCMLLSPGGMADMSKRGIMCSVIRDAVTAVENRETARSELNKAASLWRIALEFGFVYEAKDFIHALSNSAAS